MLKKIGVNEHYIIDTVKGGAKKKNSRSPAALNAS